MGKLSKNSLYNFSIANMRRTLRCITVDALFGRKFDSYRNVACWWRLRKAAADARRPRIVSNKLIMLVIFSLSV